ncbi:MAG: hypothetical protein AMXMBFR61_19300 [Fimbriimonadales bacterium]
MATMPAMSKTDITMTAPRGTVCAGFRQRYRTGESGCRRERARTGARDTVVVASAVVFISCFAAPTFYASPTRAVADNKTFGMCYA